MSRYRDTLNQDDPSGGEGDAQWTGIWPQARPDQVQPGFAHMAENMTFAERDAQTRPGSYTPASFLHAGFTGPLYGSAVWSDPDGLEWLLIAAADGIWRMRDGHTARKIAIPENLAARVEIVPAFNRVLVFRGEDLTPWVWLGKLTTGFAAVSQAATEDGTVPIPNGPVTGQGLKPVLLNQRLFVPHSKRLLAASDLLDYVRYDAAFDDFNLSGVGDDALVGLLPFAGAAILVGNDQSLQLLDGLSADLSGSRLFPVNSRIGVCGGATMATVGAEVFFLSNPGGVYRVSQVTESRIATVPLPVSYPITPLIERINFTAASAAVAAVFDGSYWLAVPLDDATGNNAILRYDTQLEAWQSLDTYPAGVQLSALHVTDYQGAKRLYAADYANARVHLLEQGRHDTLGGGNAGATVYHPIVSRLAVRGYLLSENQPKRFMRGRVHLRGWNPSYQVRAIGEGVNDTTALLAAQTPARTKFKVWGKPDYVATNANNDHAGEDRQDYSVTTPFYTGADGISFDLEQAHEEPFVIRLRGRYLQLEITNATGTLAIASTQVDANAADRALRAS